MLWKQKVIVLTDKELCYQCPAIVVGSTVAGVCGCSQNADLMEWKCSPECAQTHLGKGYFETQGSSA